jgi:hypothetical protein
MSVSTLGWHPNPNKWLHPRWCSRLFLLINFHEILDGHHRRIFIGRYANYGG